ncbi:MAG: 16S rRNA (guanine(966)-N(2))-methyltransferase RsmD [Methylomonas sp.]|jgi:16S rRNA (guanine966-N2)-methyltransferase|uniref:16S rRNA (guanine(966)-N(2))-methyltransferase RsmD n=1 Tax=Methylomonas sp. TaxID=418 RepID=UPI0025FC2ACA|nr:16S rRNA (guanine(966)-N(2))-methyltransferase RsmD [Methylomonas sp.]MCK9606620.1 16S rRNA (guanine(966)-N(2))-methyltransferase RsmD [Methylomonas sp.]
MSNKLRIIGGEWRSRLIAFDDAPGLRPTPARIRETLFNWLQADVANSRCLDLFAGSGALGFEAASRGAKQVVQVENNPQTCRKLKENCAALATERIEVVQVDVLQFMELGNAAFDLIFLDPPFGQDLVKPICRRLTEVGLLAEFGKIYIETERNLALNDLPDHWQCLKYKQAGEVAYSLYQSR